MVGRGQAPDQVPPKYWCTSVSPPSKFLSPPPVAPPHGRIFFCFYESQPVCSHPCLLECQRLIGMQPFFLLLSFSGRYMMYVS